MNKRRPVVTNENPWEKAVQEELLGTQEPTSPGWIGWLRRFMASLTVRRRHRREELDFSSPAQARLRTEGFDKEVAPTNISEGGIGVRLPAPYLSDFQIGQEVTLRLTLDGTEWHETAGIVRCLLHQSAAQGHIGIEFVSPPAALLSAMRASRAKKRVP